MKLLAYKTIVSVFCLPWRPHHIKQSICRSYLGPTRTPY